MNDNFKIKFGHRIKELRLANKLTQESLAEKLNIERTYLARIEAGRHFPSPELLSKFAAVLNAGIPDLFDTGHFKNKETVINEILSALNEFEMDKLQYVYKSIMNLKIIK